MIVFLLLSALLAQDVAEQEPNNDRDQARQAVAPGATIVGDLKTAGDVDWFLVTCERDTVCTVELEFEKGTSAQLEVSFTRTPLRTLMKGSPLRLVRLRFPKGRTPLGVSGSSQGYRCRLTVEELGERIETEPNDSAEEAIEIREGEAWKGLRSGYPGEVDTYAFKAATPGARQVILKRGPRKQSTIRADLRVVGTAPGMRQYYYLINDFDSEFHFYPVLDPGTWHLQVTIFDEQPVGEAYEISVHPVPVKVTEEERKAAEAAIDRGVRFLLKVPETRAYDQVTVAAESLVLAALSEGRGAKDRRDGLDRDSVAWLEAGFTKVGGDGAPEVHLIGPGIYPHLMATLGLAEAVANGSERAKEPATRATRFLIATQNTGRKPKAWNGPIDKQARGFGGWRYEPSDTSSDLSIVGWGIVALTAVDASGLKADGLRDSVEAALEYVRTVGDERGFGYESPGGDSCIHNSIGALVQLLYGEESSPLSFAKRELDAHLWAATGVDRGDVYPFYYLYYATRAQYLRGGDEWQVWRATALRQLLRRQQEDGSWEAIHYENQTGPRWTTALAVMMLRLCLDQPPKYLRVEAKGF